jgi:HEAT repeat protein
MLMGGSAWRMGLTIVALAGIAIGSGVALAQNRATEVRPFEDVVRELDSHDPKIRVEAMRALARAGHPEAIGHIARLLTDSVEDIQVEAIDTLLNFYLLDIPTKAKRVAGVFEVGKGSRAEAAFELGPFVLLPRPVPDALKRGLAGAMRDDWARLRAEATWTLGALVPPPAGAEAEQALAANLRDPEIPVRLAAARVAGAVRAASLGDALVAAMNDPNEKVRLAAMRSLGDIREERGVRALREQLEFHKRGPLARAALDGLARIASPQSLPTFQEHVSDRDAELRRSAIEGVARVGDAETLKALVVALAGERHATVRLTRAFATERSGGAGIGELVSGLDTRDSDLAMAYIVELGQPAVPGLATLLKSPEARVRERIAQILGLIGGSAAKVALEPTTKDPDVYVARAAERALARIRLYDASR